MKINPKAVVVLAALFCSLSAIFFKFSSAPAVTVAAWRMGFTVLILLPVILKKHRKELASVDKKSLLLCCLSGLFLGLHFTAYFESLNHTSVTSSVVLVDTQVIFVALIMLIVLKEKIPKKGVIGIALTLIGSVVIGMADGSAGGDNILYGDFLALGGAVFLAIYTSIGYVARRSISTTVYTFTVYLMSFITLAVIAIISGAGLTGYPPENLLLSLLLSVFCTLLGHSLYNWSLKYISAAFMSTVSLLEPVFSTVFAIFIFSEIPVPLQIAGVVIIIIGVAVYSSAKESAKSE